MKSSSPLRAACLILSWLAIAAGLLGLLVSGLQVAGMLPAPEILWATTFIAAAVVFGTGLVPLTVLDGKQPACLYFSWFGIVAGGLGLIRHSISACGLWLKLHRHYPYPPDTAYEAVASHWTACIGCAVLFGAGLVSLAIIASQRPQTPNDQVNHKN